MEFLKTHKLIILLLLFLSIPALSPLFHSGFFQTDDGEWMIIRFSAFHQALASGQLPVRFLDRLNYGFGYPVANFLYPGFMYLGEILKILGFGFVDVIKITLGICLIESFVFTYFWLQSIFKKWQSLLGAFVYLYSWYHLYDVYKRGSVGEVLALATVPFILWQIERKSFFWTSLGVALLILSHNTLALIFFPVIIIYIFIRQRKSLIFYYLSLIFGLGLSAFFWIPALFDLQYTVFSKTQVSNWRLYFVDISLIGFSTLLIFCGTAISLYIKRQEKQLQLSLYFFVVGLLSIFFATNVSAVFWEALPVSFVQFPFRFLSVALLCSAFLSAFIVSQVYRKINIVFVTGLIFLLFIEAKPFLTSIEYFDKGDSYYSTNEATTTVQDEYMPIWVKEKPTMHFVSKVLLLNGQAVINNVVSTNKQTVFLIDAKESVEVAVQTVYFPGWYAFIDEKQTNITYNNSQGIIQIAIPSGLHAIRVEFQETPIRLLSDGITLISGMIFIFFLIKERKKLFFKI